jgi:hypothetical protein
LLKCTSMSVTSISFTTDIWTSDVSPMSMRSLTAQWVDEDFVLRKAILHAQECAGSHTAAAISMALDNMNTLLAPFEQLTREISSSVSAADLIHCHGIEMPAQQNC